MTVRINGETRAIEAGSTVAELLERLGLAGREGGHGVAVVVDRQVVPRGEHATTTLQEGSRVEILRAVGGG